MTTAKRAQECRHTGDERKKLPDGKIHCLACGKVFTSPKAPARHGTERGFRKHRRDRTARWPWPAELGTCGCKEASLEYGRTVRAIPENAALRHQRDAARQAALLRLRRQFPSEYQRHYSDEMLRRSDGTIASSGDAVPLPLWDDLMAQLVKSLLGRDEHEVLTRVRGGWSTQREKTAIRLIARLRAILAVVEGR
jgi:hypothetical protein